MNARNAAEISIDRPLIHDEICAGLEEVFVSDRSELSPPQAAV